MLINLNQRRVIFLEDIKGIPTFIGKRNMKKDSNSVNFRKGTYMINSDHPGYVFQNRIYYFMYAETHTQVELGLNNEECTIDPAFVKAMIFNNSAAGFAARIGTANSDLRLLLFVAVGAIAGIPLGIVIGPIIGV